MPTWGTNTRDTMSCSKPGALMITHLVGTRAMAPMSGVRRRTVTSSSTMTTVSNRDAP